MIIVCACGFWFSDFLKKVTKCNEKKLSLLIILVPRSKELNLSHMRFYICTKNMKLVYYHDRTDDRVCG